MEYDSDSDDEFYAQQVAVNDELMMQWGLMNPDEVNDRTIWPCCKVKPVITPEFVFAGLSNEVADEEIWKLIQDMFVKHLDNFPFSSELELFNPPDVLEVNLEEEIPVHASKKQKTI